MSHFLTPPQLLTLSNMPSGIHSHRPLFYPQPPPRTLPSPLDLTETWLSPEDSRPSLRFFFSSLQPLATGSGSGAGVPLARITLRPFSLCPPQKLYLWISCQEIIYNSPPPHCCWHLPNTVYFLPLVFSKLELLAHSLQRYYPSFILAISVHTTQMSLAYSHLPVLLFLLSWLIPTSIPIGYFSHTSCCSIFIFTEKLFEYVVYTVSHSSPLILRYPTPIQLIAPQKLLSTHSRMTVNVTKRNAQFFVSGPIVAATIFTYGHAQGDAVTIIYMHSHT